MIQINTIEQISQETEQGHLIAVSVVFDYLENPNTNLTPFAEGIVSGLVEVLYRRLPIDEAGRTVTRLECILASSSADRKSLHTTQT